MVKSEESEYDMVEDSVAVLNLQNTQVNKVKYFSSLPYIFKFTSNPALLLFFLRFYHPQIKQVLIRKFD